MSALRSSEAHHRHRGTHSKEELLELCTGGNANLCVEGRIDLISWNIQRKHRTQSREGRSRTGKACTIPLLCHPSSQSAKLNVGSWGKTDRPSQGVETYKDLKTSSQKKMEWGPEKEDPDVFNKWILHHSFCLIEAGTISSRDIYINNCLPCRFPPVPGCSSLRPDSFLFPKSHPRAHVPTPMMGHVPKCKSSIYKWQDSLEFMK